MNNETRKILEASRRLSTSSLWDLQSAAYSHYGPSAWKSKGVPFYITSNPYIARQYALVALGYVRDLIKKQTINYAEPLYIFDLGAGSGRFGYLFLKCFHELVGIIHKDIRICYVMTDFVEENIDYWRHHPYLQGFIKAQLLDFAYYHHSFEHQSLDLRISKKKLSQSTLVNPMVIIGNYFFDTIPQDLFKAKEGKLYEGQVTLSVEKPQMLEDIQEGDPSIIEYLHTDFNYVPIDRLEDYYPEFPELLPILKNYAQRFEDIPFLFPCGAFKTIKFFRNLSRDNMLLIAGDQGRINEKQLEEYRDPYIAKHASFSIPVNYHAIAGYIRDQGGMCLLTTHAEVLFVVSASVFFSKEGSDYPETRLAFKLNIDQFEPCDYYLLVDYTEKEWKQPSLNFIILLIKLGNWDLHTSFIFFEAIRSYLPQAPEREKNKLAEAINCSFSHFFPISEEEAHFVMNLGVIFGEMERWKDAYHYFEKALILNNKVPLIAANLAVCCDKLGLKDKAQELRIQIKNNNTEFSLNH